LRQLLRRVRAAAATEEIAVDLTAIAPESVLDQIGSISPVVHGFRT